MAESVIDTDILFADYFWGLPPPDSQWFSNYTSIYVLIHFPFKIGKQFNAGDH